MVDILERLQSPQTSLGTLWPQPNLHEEAADEITRLREENARLREALEPFAEMLKGNYSHQSDNMPIKAGANQYDLVFVFTLGDLRKAAAAIREGGKDG